MDTSFISYWANSIIDNGVDQIIEHSDYLYESTDAEIISESNIPDDEQSLRAACKDTSSTEKFSPTESFLVNAYKLLSPLFPDRLPDPSRLQFNVKSQPRATWMGLASCHYNRSTQRITPTAISLNGSRQMTLHDWLETVIHEMIHIIDYVYHSEHFTGVYSKLYDAHGKWFLTYGEQFNEYGFHVQQFCKAEVGVNVEDKNVKKILNNSVFIKLDGFKEEYGGAIIRISDKDIEKYREIFYYGARRGRFKGLKKLIFLKSSNPDIVRLKQVRMKDQYSSLNFYYFDDRFEKNYGPFEEIESWEIPNLDRVAEDKDEMDIDDMNTIDDEYARKMYDNIKGVVDVQKLDDDEYEVSIA